ncbi:MAG: betaine-aldehyde dehydrogenase [Candidatus Puniceispirillaceae bacterium]
MQIIRSIINGTQTPSQNGKPPIIKYYPATGEAIAEVERADHAMLDEAVRHAKEAQKKWAALGNVERSHILYAIAQGLQDANDELSRLEVQDVGKLYSEAVSADVPSGAEAFSFFASLCATMTGTSHSWPDAIGYTKRVPLGVCAGVGAWNYPTQIACWKSAPALATGNAFILKPSEETPLTANRIAEIMKEAGLPDGLFQVLQGDHEIGAALCAHKGIAKISLTGGVDTGKLIMKQSADSLKKVTLELGGKAPLVIFDDADFETAVQTAMDANFYTAGEVCSNATRVFIQDGIAPAIIAEMVKRTGEMRIGDPMSEDVQIGALISKAHHNKVLDYIRIGEEEGATIAVGGKAVQPQGFEGGNFIAPTIMTNCRDDMRIVKEEIFGPVMSVLTFKTEEEAIARANDTEFGLGAGVITSDLSRAHRVADQLEAGNVWVNTYNLIPADWPFGGSKQSGFGREASQFAIESYTEIKATYIQL